MSSSRFAAGGRRCEAVGAERWQRRGGVGPIPAAVCAVVRVVVAGLATSATAAPATASPRELRVAIDDNYPPYIFRDSSGGLTGYLPEWWALWEKSTGVRAVLLATNWAEAQRLMDTGLADVIDTLFDTPERRRKFEFSEPYAEIEVPLFVHRDVAGIHDVTTLRGFVVGAKAGDAAVDWLRRNGVTNVEKHASYEGLIRTAADGGVRVFTVDRPPAMYYMAKLDIKDRFREAMILYTGRFHRAVRAGRADLLAEIEEGFRRIPVSEVRRLGRKWFGRQILPPVLVRGVRLCVTVGAAIGATLVVFILVLRRQVRQKTSELEAAVAAQEKTAEHLRGILRAAPAGIGVVRHRVFLDVNDHMCRMTGYSREELIGANARMLYPDEAEFERVGRLKYEEIRRMGAGAIETRWRRRDGTLCNVHLSAVAFRPADPDSEVVFVALDITEVKRTAARALELERELQHAQKLESLGLMAGGIAHDFNNLLTAVLGHVSLAMEALPPASPIRPDLAAAQDAVRRAADLTRQLLVYAGRAAPSRCPLDLTEVVRAMFPLVRLGVSKKIDFRFECREGLPRVEADRAQVQQVAMNLMLNAAEAIGEGTGTVVVSVYACRPGPANGYRPLAQSREGNHVAIEVADNGCGISAADMPRIFDPFFSNKQFGRGLGLSAVLGVLRGHDGFIEVQSEPGRGTVFRAFFPAAEGAVPAAGTAAEEEPAVEKKGRGSGVVLLVDDEERLRAIGAAMLCRLGFTACTAADGDAACAATRATPPACVLMDLTMPLMDGVEAFRRLREINPTVPVVLCSGYDEGENARRFGHVGFAGFLQKPYHLQRLGAVLRRVLASSG